MSVANFAYCLGLRFTCSDAFSVGIQYSYLKSPGVHFLDENGTQLFAPAINVEENQWTFSCILHIL
jgi:opacity protein-like surface antigen